MATTYEDLICNYNLATTTGTIAQLPEFRLGTSEEKKPKKSMALSKLQKASLDADTQTLMEHGVLDDELTVDYENSDLWDFLVLKFKSELAAQLRADDEAEAAKAAQKNK